ncbi:MAG: ASCH domain-containing protein [Alphaproteobacteria bacterium]|nr:ASCH domain-containing protein [Alphaproteobacteria bacterium]
MTKKSVDWRSLEQFAFGDGPELANELASLVLAGKKRATCWAASEGPKTEPGRRWVVLDGSGDPVAVIETVELTQRRFDEIDEALAFDEGEGDCTLAYWRRAHQSYFTQQGTFAPDMLLYCEHFRLVAIIPPDQLKPSGAAPADGR